MLAALYEQSAAYATSVCEFSGVFLRRRNALDAAQLALSRRYFSVVRDGHEAFVYPGNLAIAEDLSNGLHPEAPRELCVMTTVSLDMRPRSTGDSTHVAAGAE